MFATQKVVGYLFNTVIMFILLIYKKLKSRKIGIETTEQQLFKMLILADSKMGTRVLVCTKLFDSRNKTILR